MNNKAIDPYVCPKTHILINHFNVKNQAILDLLELTFFRKRLAEGIPRGSLDFTHYKSIHKHILQDLYNWAGVERTVAITNGERQYTMPERIAQCMDMILHSLKKDNHLRNLQTSDFVNKMAHYFIELKLVHPFRKGNDITLRLFTDEIAYNAGYSLNWDKIQKELYIKASLDGFDGKYDLIVQLFDDIVQLKNKNTPEHNEKVRMLNDNNISISDSLYRNILKYIDEVDKYENLLYLVYNKGFEKIDAEITSSLSLQKHLLKELINQIVIDESWDILEEYTRMSPNVTTCHIDLQSIQSDLHR
jgi:cell filamentation protein